MDCHTGSLIKLNQCIPESVISGISINLATYNDIINTYKAIEIAHWAYLDNYSDHDKQKYPSCNIRQFSKLLFNNKNCPEHWQYIDDYIKIYNRYKKSLPTAGIIFYNIAENNILFVVVRMKNTKIFSMPKGKKDLDDVSLIKTASREFKEETGVDVEEFLEIDTPHKNINKTLFYIIETDNKNIKFKGYNTNEIAEVKWVNTQDVIRNHSQYSKQTISAAKYLEDIAITNS